jgi:hypothetical protein
MKNKDLKVVTSFMLHVRYLPSKIWVEELNYVSYLHKKSPHRFVEYMNTFEASKGDKPNVTHFHIFRSQTWDHIPSEKRKGLDRHTTPFIFMGYLDNAKWYNIIDPSTYQLMIDYNIQFEEIPLHAPLV